MQTEKSNVKQKITDWFIWFILMNIMTFSLTYMITYALKFEYPYEKLIAATCISLGTCSIILLNKWTVRITVLLGTLSVLAGSFYLYKKHLLKLVYEVLVERAISFFKWSSSCLQGYPLEEHFYIHYFTILVCIIIAIFVYYFTIKKFHFFVLFTAGVFLFVFEVTQKRAISSIALYMFVFASLIYFFKSRYLALRKQLDEHDYGTYRAFMNMSLCTGAAIFLCGAVLANAYPYKAIWIHDLADSLTKKAYYYKVDNFSVKSAGLQEEDGLLGGDIKPNDAIVLAVDTQVPIYLKARSEAIYTGTAWKSEKTEPAVFNLKEQKLEDTDETIEAVKWLGADKNSLHTLFDKYTANIRFVNMSTKSLFVPPKTTSFKITSWKRDVFLTYTDRLSLKKAANKNFAYTTEFYQPKYTSEIFQEVIKKSRIGFYNEIKEDHPEDTERIHKWAEHAANITQKYTELPEGLPKRVRELAATITKDQSNNYDKVKAIEGYLVANYAYTLKPGQADEKKDFVDTFLFENKKGYCTYFASAMAVLTRSVGVPCRYVEGYILPNTRKAGEKVYYVTNKRAHAWIEVYFEGMGWIIFEATPPYKQSERVNPTAVSMEEMMRNSQSSYTGNIGSITLDKGEKSKIYFIFGVIGIGIIGGIILLYKMRKNKLTKMTPREATLYLYSQYLDLLFVQKLSIQGGETEKMFAKRIDTRFPGGAISFKEITSIFLRARYSQIEITETEKKIMIDYKEILLNYSKRAVGLVTYLIYKIKYALL